MLEVQCVDFLVEELPMTGRHAMSKVAAQTAHLFSVGKASLHEATAEQKAVALELELGSLGGLGVEIMASTVLLSEGFWFSILGL